MRKHAFPALIIITMLTASILFFPLCFVKAETPILTDDFESGNLNNWNSQVGSPSVVTGPVYGGSYSADFPLETAGCYAAKTIAPTDTLNYTYYVYFGGLCTDYICVVLAEDASGTLIHYRVQDSDGYYQWQFNVGSSQVMNATGPSVNLGEWYKIQLIAYTGVNGTFYFLVNDQLKATITNQTFGAITELRIGHDWEVGYIGGDTYFDNVIATSITSPIIIASAGDGGSITPAGPVSVSYKGNQAFQITPNQGYHVSDVLVDGVSVGPVNTYDFVNVIAVHTIVASFAINSYTIYASANAGGAINPSGQIIVNYGDSQTFNIAANSGYHVASVTVNGTSVGAVTSYKLTSIQGNYVISAFFEPDATPTPTPTASPSPSPSQSTSQTPTPATTFRPPEHDVYIPTVNFK